MCAYCCGGVPHAKRGEGHKNCSTECYNAVTPYRAQQYVERAEAAEAEVARLQALLDAAAPGGVGFAPGRSGEAVPE